MYCALVRYLSEENKESRELLFTRVVNDSKATKKNYQNLSWRNMNDVRECIYLFF